MARQWYVVADAGRARIFSTNSSALKADEIDDVSNDAMRMREQDLVSDRPGRVRSGSSHNHPLNPPSHKEAAAQHFAGKVAQLIDSARHDGRFERLILIAPPGFLGMLRKKLSPQVVKTVRAEHAHDYVNDSVKDIRERLQHLEH